MYHWHEKESLQKYQGSLWPAFQTYQAWTPTTHHLTALLNFCLSLCLYVSQCFITYIFISYTVLNYIYTVSKCMYSPVDINIIIGEIILCGCTLDPWTKWMEMRGTNHSKKSVYNIWLPKKLQLFLSLHRRLVSGFSATKIHGCSSPLYKMM